MSVDTKHPLYLEFDQDWIQLRETYRGERIVKEAGFKYLPATSGMIEDGIANTEAPGFKAYTAYRKRARFPELVKEAVESMLGVMHNKPPSIELPAALEPLREKFTLRNESLNMLLRRINEEQLITGRLGLLLEVPEAVPAEGGAVLPFAALYRAEHLINWDEGDVDKTKPDSLNLVAIDESEEERTRGFEWEFVTKHRILVLGDPFKNEQAGEGVYQVGVFRENVEFTTEALITPSIGGRTMPRIPFVFVNTKDVVPTPDEAPLLGLSNLTTTIYRGEADYRQALFLQGQDTLVTIGNTNTEGDLIRVGAGASISLPIDGDAKFIGVSADGLSEMRESLQNDYTQGNQKAGSLLEAVSRSAESGEALRVRVAARTASLNQIAMAGAFALQELLRMAAEWVGANPEEVIVEPNLDFVADIMAGKELVDLMAAKGLGAPLSIESIHSLQVERGLTTKTFEEELEAMEEEANQGMPGAITPGQEDQSGTAEPEEDEEGGEDQDDEGTSHLDDEEDRDN